MSETKSVTRYTDDQNGRGRGLVSGQDFKKGAVIALYAVRSTLYSEVNFERDQEYIYDDPIKPTHTYIGTGPARYINDAVPSSVINVLRKCRTHADINAWYKRYNDAILDAVSTDAINIRFEPIDGALYAIAECNIAAGTNLYTVYGPLYWLDHIGRVTTNPRTKFACCAAIGALRRYPSIGRHIPILPISDECSIANPHMKNLSMESDVARVILAAEQWSKLIGVDGSYWVWCDQYQGVLPMPDEKCVCGKVTARSCTGCYSVVYCSISCQRAHRSVHGPVCKK